MKRRRFAHFTYQTSFFSALGLCAIACLILAAVIALSDNIGTQSVDANDELPDPASNLNYQNSTPTPQTTPTIGPQVITVQSGEYRMDIIRIWQTDRAGNRRPDREYFLILDIILYNFNDREVCFRSGDFPAVARGRDLKPSNLEAVRDEFYDNRNYPGDVRGQCIGGKKNRASLLVYDVPNDVTSFLLEFNPENEETEFSIALVPIDGTDFAFSIEEVQRGDVFMITPGPSPTPTLTLTATSTFTPSITPTPSSTFTPSPTFTASMTPTASPTYAPRIITPQAITPQAIVTRRPATSPANSSTSNTVSVQPASGTRYISSGSTVNIRSGPGTNYTIIGSALNGSEITVTGQANGWYQIDYNGQEGWVLGTLTSDTRPSLGGSGNNNSGGSGNVNDPSVYDDCDMSICSQYPTLFRCSDADQPPWNVLTSHQIACCWRSRDADNDGFACYGE